MARMPFRARGDKEAKGPFGDAQLQHPQHDMFCARVQLAKDIPTISARDRDRPSEEVHMINNVSRLRQAPVYPLATRPSRTPSVSLARAQSTPLAPIL